MGNILFIGPSFYGYEKAITKELGKLFSKVFYVCEYPLGGVEKYSIFEKVFPFLKSYIWNCYNRRVLEIVKKNKVNQILIIRGALLSESLVKELSSINDIEIFHYQWDSVVNNPNALMLTKYCKHNFTFDPKDAVENKSFQYLPLFYYWDDCLFSSKTHHYNKYDIIFVGSWSKERIEYYSSIKSLCDNNKLTLYKHIYMPLQTCVRKLICHEHIPNNILSFKKIDKNKYYKLLFSSKVVFDVPSPSQRGATIRTIEALSLQKKIISTNVWLKKEEFYSPNNILIFPCEQSRIGEFLSQPFEKCDEKIYSLRMWIREIFAI